MNRRCWTLGSGDDHHVTVAVRNRMCRGGVRGVSAWADVVPRVGDRSGIVTGTYDLADLVSHRVFADFIDRHRMAAAMNLEGDLAFLLNGHLLWCEVVV